MTSRADLRRAKYQTANDVLASASELGLQADSFLQASPGRWESILNSVLERFTISQNPNLLWLWNDLKQKGKAVQLSNGLKHFESMVDGNTPVWLLLENSGSQKARGNFWVFEGRYSSVIQVLWNMYGIEYYIVERNLTWMLLENHHDIFVGVGEPAESFVERIEQSQR